MGRGATYEEVVVVVLLDGTAVHVEEDQDGMDQVAEVRQLADRHEEIPRKERVDEPWNQSAALQRTRMRRV